MPIAKVEGPDGKVHRLEVPEGATPQEIEAFAAEAIPQAAQQKPVQKSEAYGAALLKGIPFGQDIGANIGAAVYGRDVDLPFFGPGGKADLAKRELQRLSAAGQEQYPGVSATGTIATAIPTAMMVPAKVMQAPSVLGRAVKGTAVAAGLGTAYGLGEGNTPEERISSGITQGVMAAPFGAAGSLASDAIGAGYRASRGLAKRAAGLFNQAQRPPQNLTIDVQAAGGLDDIQRAMQQTPAPVSMDTIPLTRGQALQAVPGRAQDAAKAQALEYGAAAGSFGDEAQRMALEAQELQTTAARDVMSRLSGDTAPDIAVDNLRKSLSQSYKSAQAKTSAAYKEVGELAQDKPLMIAADYVRDGVVPSLKEWARKGGSGTGFDLKSPDMANGKRLYDQAAQFGDMKKISAVNFFRMENWRGRVSQGIANSKTPAEKAFLSGMLQRYDTAMSQLPREAVKSGDDAILSAMEKARGARKAQGVLFERSKLVKDVLTNDDLTNEQFFNTLTSLGPKSGTYVRDILRTAANDPAKQAALRDQVRQSVVGSIVNKSLSSEVRAGGSGTIEKMISFDKLATNLEKLTANKTLFNQVFPDPAEQALVKDVLRSSQLIKSVKPGSKNYSNTAYTLMRLLNGVSPAAKSMNIAGIGPGSALDAMAQAGAVQELSQSLAPVLKGVADEATGPLTNFGAKYGRQIMSGSLAAGAGND